MDHGAMAGSWRQSEVRQRQETEIGAVLDMRVDTPRTQPWTTQAIGLRNNGGV